MSSTKKKSTRSRQDITFPTFSTNIREFETLQTLTSTSSSVPIEILPQLYVGLVTQRSSKKYSGTIENLTVRTIDEHTQLELNKTELKKLFLNSLFCQDNLRESYISEAMENNTHFFIMFYLYNALNKRTGKMTPKIVPVSFVIGKPIRDIFYVDIICSKETEDIFTQHSGKVLLDEVEKYARSQDLKEIKLRALPHVLTYYPRQQFEHRTPCDEPTGPETLPIVQARKRLLQMLGKNFPKNIDEAVDNEHVMDYMVTLQLAGYGDISRVECQPTHPDETLKTEDEIRDDILSKKCFEHGYLMRKCL